MIFSVMMWYWENLRILVSKSRHKENGLALGARMISGFMAILKVLPMFISIFVGMKLVNQKERMVLTTPKLYDTLLKIKESYGT
jgi:hypothetical protein